MIYASDKHRTRYEELLRAYSINGTTDIYRTVLAYLIALTDETYKHRAELYNEEERSIIPEGLKADFQTGTTTKLTLLAFNLFTSSTAFCDDDMRAYCTPDYIFESSFSPYFIQALKIRYPT